jgi:hypothetical protein
MSEDIAFGSARKQHYVFAHLAFRALVESSPMHVLMTMLSRENGPKLLDEVWEQVSSQCTQRDLVDAEGLTYEIHELSDKRPVILIEMPTPRGVREAYFTATVITPPKRRFFLFPRPAKTRYFTLEIGDTEKGEFDTLLGEWRGEEHLNYSDNPTVEKRAFLRAVVRVLKGEISPQGTTDHPTRLE